MEGSHARRKSRALRSQSSRSEVKASKCSIEEESKQKQHIPIVYMYSTVQYRAN